MAIAIDLALLFWDCRSGFLILRSEEHASHRETTDSYRKKKAYIHRNYTLFSIGKPHDALISGRLRIACQLLILHRALFITKSLSKNPNHSCASYDGVSRRDFRRFTYSVKWKTLTGSYAILQVFLRESRNKTVVADSIAEVSCDWNHRMNSIVTYLLFVQTP